MHDNPGCGSGGGAKIYFSSNELSFIKLVNFRFSGLVLFDSPGY